MKNIIRILSLVLILATALGMVGCSKTNPEAGDRTVIHFAASGVKASVSPYYEELVKTYNDTQGKIDGVFVEMVPTSTQISGLDVALRSNYLYDVVEVGDDQFKTLVLQSADYFVSLDQYMTDEVKTAMAYDQIPESLIERFSMNTSAEADGRYLAGEGTQLLALPNGSNPHLLFYNKTILENCGINIVSVAEADLDAYNQANGASLKPHGYAEYKEAPFDGAKSSENENGEFVYKVFNNRIPMNWEETRVLCRAFQKQYDYEYGYMSEWWFNYGWSVGGDCVGYDETKGQYVMTLGDKQNNYLVTRNVTVNGNAYAAGDILSYEDKRFLNANAQELAKVESSLYVLPSQYDATMEFNRLGIPSDKEAETGVYGYGIAPNTVENRTQRFASGVDCPFLIDSYGEALSFQKVLGDSLELAVPTCYREYEGGSTYQKDGQAGFENEYLKVIGETYDGVVYTGDVKEVNGTPIVGRSTAASAASGFFLPKNTRNKNYDAAFKFASWAAGPEGQKIISKGNTLVPNQSDFALGEFAESADRAIANMWAGAWIALEGDIGDYTYFTTSTWITEWSVTFNSDVRKGNMTLTQFLEEKQEVADKSLKNMRIRIVGR